MNGFFARVPAGIRAKKRFWFYSRSESSLSVM